MHASFSNTVNMDKQLQPIIFCLGYDYVTHPYLNLGYDLANRRWSSVMDQLLHTIVLSRHNLNAAI